jgi:quinol monooxygenase YgiN
MTATDAGTVALQAVRLRIMFMLHGRLAAKPGRRDELLAILAEGEDAPPMPGCRLYVVAVDEDDPDGVWATEVWESDEAHAASLQLESVRERIGRAMPLVDPAGIKQQRLRAVAGVP